MRPALRLAALIAVLMTLRLSVWLAIAGLAFAFDLGQRLHRGA
jgi:hypothetical protein